MRGVIKHRERRKQILDFRDLLWGRITPTDIDLSLDFGGKYFVLGEVKLKGAPLSFGQRMHLGYLAEGLEAGGRQVLGLIAEHQHASDIDIRVGDLPVREIWWQGHWQSTRDLSVLQSVTIARQYWGLEPTLGRPPDAERGCAR